MFARTAGIAFAAGALVATLGGLIGLGGAEFRLPILVAGFGLVLRRAVHVNLAISLVTVTIAAVVRLQLGGLGPTPMSAVGVAAGMVVGAMLGAWAGAAWLAGASEAGLHRAIRGLLLALGLLLIVEAGLVWESPGLPLPEAGRVAVAAAVGLAVGVVSSMLGVAGGELIIPALVLGFGIEVKTAGTLSVLIALPTIVVGLARRPALWAGGSRADLWTCVVPMAAGSLLGAAAGGALVGVVPGAALKVVLGVLLIGSALHVFRPQPTGPPPHSRIVA